jgi:hypothetical protein
MEWTIAVRPPNGEQSIPVANFSPASELYKNQAYPDALVKLGCSILKRREEKKSLTIPTPKAKSDARMSPPNIELHSCYVVLLVLSFSLAGR